MHKVIQYLYHLFFLPVKIEACLVSLLAKLLFFGVLSSLLDKSDSCLGRGKCRLGLLEWLTLGELILLGEIYSAEAAVE